MSWPEIAGDPRFFAQSGPFPLSAVAAAAQVAWTGADDKLLIGVAALQIAGPDQVSFLDNRRYAGALAATTAGAVICHPDMAAKAPEGVCGPADPGAVSGLGTGRRAVPPRAAATPGYSSLGGARGRCHG